MLKAVIFDMDGVLIDSEPFWREAEIAVFGRVGLHLTDAMCRETMGLRIDEAVNYWHKKHRWEGQTPGEVAEAVVSDLIELIGTRGELMPGVRDALSFFRSREVKIALASSSAYRIIDAVVKQLGLASAFDCVYSAEEEEYGKPHPGVYLTTAARLGVAPTECLAIEDSLNGVLAAKAARMKCLAIPDADSRLDPRFAIADHTLGSLADVGEELWRQLNQK
ncbi:MAG TPA: hexitol phosphatase HxpB [Pyrinomonadaceae bacterium]|jgi:sugar-phosphatase